MAHVILGLLLISPQSLYGLIKAFEAGPSLFYSASSGSIKRALDGLLARDLIEVVDAGARGKKIYHVTDAGRAEFRSWMLSDITGTDLETAMLSRHFFLGLLEPVDRTQVLQLITARLDADLARLVALDEHLDTVEIPEGYHDVAAYQRATLDYGIASDRFTIDWFRKRYEDAGA